MKAVILLLALTLAAMATDSISFYYLSESVPASLPGADVEPAGIMVFVASPADGATVCATTATATTCALAVDDGYGYAIVRLNVVEPSNVSVFMAGESISVDDPVAGVVYP